ncbi:GNAT family N-acetyltransferase [uncultured Clostridium sp.]|uniref:GNAT family N-acetyltransferase n=1 Tax=uncultured Clostridium sp. TaxID=59620 RepID=UPI0025F5A86A|nr:GNAT family N-acetyltransferase [uncultured Clostridium sp.]
MNNYIIQECDDKLGEEVIDKLVYYNLSKVPLKQNKEFISINKIIKNEKGEIIAGILSRMYCWNCLFVDTLFVDEIYRGQGLGEKLLKEVEKVAINKGCELIHLDTFDFQAKDFYLKYGYEIFGVLEDCPQGHCRYYLKKKVRKNARR